MELSVLPLHKHPEYLFDCCRLINDEWKRSDTARLRSLESSCDFLPASLILIQKDKVIGHAKLSAIPSVKDACFVESVVIDKTLRGRGFGTYLMQKVEDHCAKTLGLKCIYLSTKGQEMFYRKLGYCECKPVSIYGGVPVANNYQAKPHRQNNHDGYVSKNKCNVPKPPPLPKSTVPEENCTKQKTFMCKIVNK